MLATALSRTRTRRKRWFFWLPSRRLSRPEISYTCDRKSILRLEILYTCNWKSSCGCTLATRVVQNLPFSPSVLVGLDRKKISFQSWNWLLFANNYLVSVVERLLFRHSSIIHRWSNPLYMFKNLHFQCGVLINHKILEVLWWLLDFLFVRVR